ncbi:hypothetical protein [Nonomuraea bangladeshensis]|uniref:hypothetical protein n=1 Tax=Nonomuraea bangladeshensis TaxID=404385 RepID=UPI003C30310E
MPSHVHLFVQPHPQLWRSYVAGQFKGKGFTSVHLRAAVQPNSQTQYERAPGGDDRA